MKPQFVSIEDVVEALASQCDGARRRDGRGFNRADAQEGGRLSALRRQDMPWSETDARKAIELAAKYPGQAAALLSGGSETRAAGIEKALRGGRVPLREDPIQDSEQKAYCYAGLSPGGRYVYFWRLAWIDDLPGLTTRLRGLSRLRHGARGIWFKTDKAELTINGTRRRAERMSIDFNGSTQAGIIQAAKAHGFLLEPAIAEPMDREVDQLRHHERAVWLHSGIRDGKRGTWAVFDLMSKNEQFSAIIKHHFRGQFDCRPDDDWNWYVTYDAETAPKLRQVALKFGFSQSADFSSGFRRNPSTAPSTVRT